MINPFTDDQIDFIRADLESGMKYTKMIEEVKKRLKAEGRDFDAELKKFQADKILRKMLDIFDDHLMEIKDEYNHMTNRELAAK